MKAVFATIFLSALSISLSAKAASAPVGTYQCPIRFVERVDISIAPGDDFPSFSRLPEARERQVTLKIDFSVNAEGPQALVQNPEVLPNILLINPDQYTNQSPWSYVDDETGELRYSIHWNDTWYFGSTVAIDTLGVSESGELLADLTFDDNDGWAFTLNSVKCTRSIGQ